MTQPQLDDSVVSEQPASSEQEVVSIKLVMEHKDGRTLALNRAPDGVGNGGVSLFWQNVATEGDFLGYRGGSDPFSLTRESFEQIVANLHAHPSYQAGANGLGCAPVVPWDFDHASCRPASDGSIPSSGVPAQGWTYEFEVRSNADGKAELWALTNFLEPAASYIRDGRYRWASLVCDLEGVDPRTGAQIGAQVISIAMTNTPFIEGMVPLAASRSVHLGALKRPEEYMQDLIKQIAAVLGCAETKEAVMSAIGAAKADVVLCKSVKARLNLTDEASAETVDDAMDESVNKAAEATSVAEATKQRLTALLAALGVENPEDAIAQIVSLMERASQLQTLLPEIEQLRAAAKSREDEEAAADVDAVMAARQLPQETRAALMLFRSEKPEQFSQTYPKRQADTRNVLARSVAQDVPATVLSATSIDLDKFAGRNRMEQAIEYVKATNPGAKEWPWETVCLAAQKALRITAAR